MSTTDKRNSVFNTREDAERIANDRMMISQADYLEREFGIKIEVHKALLPTHGLLYPVDHPFASADEVEFTPMTVKEEDIINNPTLIKNGTMAHELLRSCLLNKSVDPLSLFPGDSLAIIIALRAASYGSVYYPKVKCPGCSKQQKVTIDLNEIEEKELPEGVVPGLNEFSCILPETNLKITYKFLTDGDSKEISDEIEAKKKKGIKTNSVIAARLNKHIVAVNDNRERGRIAILTTRLPAQDSTYLRKMISDSEPGVDLRFFFTCEDEDCGYSAKLPIPMGIEFWMPGVDL